MLYHIFNTLLSNIYWYFFFFNFDLAGIQWLNNGVSNIFNREEKIKRFYRKSSSDDNTACN